MALSYGSCVLFLNSVLFSSFIHAAPCTFSSLLLTIAQESMVCTHHILFMHFPEVRDLEGLPTFCPHKWCHREHLHTCALVGPGPGFLMIVAGVELLGHRTHTNRFHQYHQITLPNGWSTLHSCPAVRKGSCFCISLTARSMIQCSNLPI